MHECGGLQCVPLPLAGHPACRQLMQLGINQWCELSRSNGVALLEALEENGDFGHEISL